MNVTEDAVIVLRGGGTCLVIAVTLPVPRVLHWGVDIDPLDDAARDALLLIGQTATLNNSPDQPRIFSLWPTESEAWAGTPAQAGHLDGTATTPRPHLTNAAVDEDCHAARWAEFTFQDTVTELIGTLRLELDGFGVLTSELSIQRPDSDSRPGWYHLHQLTALLPIPERASELMDFTGKWCRERAPQRTPLTFGTHLRAARRGKPGHDSAFLLMAGTPGFGARHGEVWATHVAWSGDQRYLAERLPEGAGPFAAVLGGGEFLQPGEVRLAAGDTYRAPRVYFVWSDAGTDGIADRLHRRLRARPEHPRSPRPLVLNTWEALYFDHDQQRLPELVSQAAAVGVERLVLDDGWFLGRRDATAGLGDWYVDTAVWPSGLTGLADLVHSHGMEFGLWFEPEMVNLDSDLARSHPGWILAPSGGEGLSFRHEYPLNLSCPEAFEYLRERIDSLIHDVGIDYIKWDHNRDLLEAVARSPLGDRPAGRTQTLALYRLFDELRRRHPGLEIESCSAGGGRIDLAIIDHTARVWASDCNDPVERSRTERWTRMLLPPELIGSHLGAATSHTTHRTTGMSLRMATALFGHAGIEMDLTRCSPAELAAIARWAGLYKELRPLLHAGEVVNGDLPDPAVGLHGVVSSDRSRGLFAWLRWETSPSAASFGVRFPGLDPAARYRVLIREEIGAAQRHQVADPAWVTEALQGGVALPGIIMSELGLVMPTLAPQQAMLIELLRIG